MERLMNRFRLGCLLFLFNFLAIHGSIAQSDDQVDFQTWSDLTLTWSFSRKLSMGGDLGFRGIVSSKDWNQFYIRSGIKYRFSSIFNVDAGLASFNNLNKNAGNVYDFRLFQDANLTWPEIGYVIFRHRWRFEQRFFFYENLDNDKNVRGRYQIQIETVDFKLFSKKRSFYLFSGFEVFVPFGTSAVELFVNQNRTSLGFGHRLTSKFHYEVHYVWQHSREFVDEGFKTTENIFRLRLFYRLNGLIQAEPADDLRNESIQ
jgi:hypothetical protein